MSSILPSNPNNMTPMDFVDASRPVIMQEGTRLFDRILLQKGDSTSDVLNFMRDVASVIQSTKSFELDKFWSNIERQVLGPNKTLSTKAKTDDTKMQAAMSMFYDALNYIDQKAVSTAELAEIDTLFQGVGQYVLNRFSGQASAKDSRVYARIVDVIDKRTTDVIERFNQRVDAQEIAGRRL